MDQNDRRAIEELFDKVDTAAQRAPAPDPEAQALIASRLARNPGAAYVMAQTIVAQEQALEQAQRQMTAAPQRSGGFLSNIFGGGGQQRPMQRGGQYGGPWGQQGYGRGGGMGGGFLAGAAQTAVGVAGGMLLADAVGDMFSGDDGGDSGGGDDGGGDGGGE